MYPLRRPCGFLVVLGLLAASFARAAEPPKPKAKAPAKPATYQVTLERLEIQVKTKGVFEAERMHEVAFRPDAWAELHVLKAVEPGARVKKGDVVLTLDATKIDEAIRDLEAGRPLAELALRLAREQVAASEKTNPLDLAAAERTNKHADEDLKRYVDIGRPLAVKSARFSVNRSQNYLEYTQEELRQLEKMYKADDLTEETEEIILKRQRNAVKRAVFNLEMAKTNADKTLNVELPRRDVTTKDNAQRQTLALAKAKATMPLALNKARLELEKQIRADRKGQEKLAKLKKDRAAMTVRSPADGIVYYGACVRGQWPKLNRSLARGTKLASHEVVMTIVEPQPVFVRATVPEKELHRLRPNLEGVATPTGYPSANLGARLRTLSPIPVTAGNFGLTIGVNVGKHAAQTVPGTTCDVKLISYRKKDAVTVPASAVFADEPDRKTYVYLRKKDGGREKRFVSVGQKTDKKAEILKGLEEGDVIFTHKPKGKT